MLTMLTVLLQPLRNQRGVVSVEWIILGAVVRAAIVLAFARQFQTALTTAVGAMRIELQTQNSGGRNEANPPSRRAESDSSWYHS